MSTTQHEQATRDIAAAVADLRGRRDQVVADLDERLGLLSQLSVQLEEGTAEIRQVQERVRRLIGERAPNPASRMIQAGRNHIGMRMTGEHTPVGPKPTAGMSMRMGGPSSAMASSSLSRAAGAVDTRVMTLLSSPRPRDETKLELALLRRLRRSLDEQSASIPEDVILIGTLIEHADDVLATIADLESGGASRVRRLLDYDRELVSQLTAMGGNGAAAKEQIQKARSVLEHMTNPQVQPAMTEAVAIFTRIQQDLAKKSPSPAVTLLDELVHV
ncbi:MAG: hypothetical protein H7Z43_10815 [Clostridia bacterium]|nr:hypothetical protein [Deltaproteobacteria bacterium]